MEYVAVTRAQKNKVIDWIASGFERYAAKCTDPSEYDLSGVDIAQIRTKMHRYSEEFDRILRANTDDNGLEMPRLRKDLLGLIDQNCPAVDVVELMVRCTSEFNVALARGLHRFEITQQDLSDLEVCHQQTAKVISELRRSNSLLSAWNCRHTAAGGKTFCLGLEIQFFLCVWDRTMGS